MIQVVAAGTRWENEGVVFPKEIGGEREKGWDKGDFFNWNSKKINKLKN